MAELSFLEETLGTAVKRPATGGLHDGWASQVIIKPCLVTRTATRAPRSTTKPHAYRNG